jgi:DNA gyrase subunit A
MAKKPQYDPEEIRFPNQKIVESALVPEMEKSYIEYAMSVIVGRALPDVRDGLKPVHRRILYAMYEDNLTSDHAFRKCATAVGDVLGRYHPHGDASVYDALVRLAQDFSMRYMLIDGHGNFGSIDGDPPAAYRYTEARLAKISDEMLRDIDKETVDWEPNFDELRKEPRVLPSRFPNLLVNGSSGIAVGMATNIPPHNMRETISAVICVLDNPDATLSELMQHIQGPDFPTKGIIMGRSGIRAAYATGRGRVVLRARHEFEEFGKDRTRIVITEIPYQVNKRMLIKNMADQVEDKRLEGISMIQDESDRNGMRIVIELKRDANPQVVLNRLFAQTQLQTSFAINMLALVEVNGKLQPKILSLRHILDEYITHQESVIVRRTRFDLRKAQERAHLLEGLLIAQDNIDEVIKIVRTSYDNAKQNLMNRFGLDDVQAQAICDMRIIALQGLNREKLENEYKELEEKISYYQKVLADEGMVRQILKEELLAISEKYGDDRVTEIQEVEDEIDIEDLIEEEQCVFTLTQAGYIKRTPVSEYTAQSKGGMGKKGITTREEDAVVDVFTASTHDYLLFFTDTGKVYRKKGYQIPVSGKTAKGSNIVNILQVEQGERVQTMIHTRSIEDDGRFLFMATRNGTVKRLPGSALKNLRNVGLRALTMDEGDRLIAVRETDGNQKILIATHDGMAVCFDENDVRPMGRQAVGVRGIKLREGDFVVGAARAKPGRHVLTITEKGFGKRTAVEEYRVTNRGVQGIKNYAITERTGGVVGIKVVDGSEDLLLVTQSGILIRTAVENIRIAGRATQGVIVMRFKEEGDQVISLALADKDENEETMQALDGVPDAPEEEKPDEETLEAMEDVREGNNMDETVSSVQELTEEPNSDD